MGLPANQSARVLLNDSMHRKDSEYFCSCSLYMYPIYPVTPGPASELWTQAMPVFQAILAATTRLILDVGHTLNANCKINFGSLGITGVF